MSPITYAASAYLLTAIISFAVITIVVIINKILMKFSSGETELTESEGE